MSTVGPPPDFGLFTSLRYDPQLLHSSENTKLSGDSAPSPFYNFVYHHERFINALDHFGWSYKTESLGANKDQKDTQRTGSGSHPDAVLPVADIETFRKAAEAAVETYFAAQTQGAGAQSIKVALKLRPVLSRKGVLEIEVSSTPATSLTNLFPQSPLPVPSEMTPPLLRPGFTLTIDPGSMTPSSHTEYKTTPRPQYDVARERAGLTSEAEQREVVLWDPKGHVMEGSRTNVYLYRGGRWVTPSEETGCLKGTERRWLLERRMVEVEDVLVQDVKDGEIMLLSNGLRGIWAGTVRRP